jgi:flagellar L-ring protein precursor FlgH
MAHLSPPRAIRLAAVLLAATSLSACGNTLHRLSNVGQEPSVSPVQNPAERQPYVTMPMPTPVVAERAANSLWRQGARAFFKDNRASQVGDILTVTINRTDTTTWANDTKRVRANTNSSGATNLLGYDMTALAGRLPGPQGTIASSATGLLNVAGALSNDAQADMARSETLNMKLAAVVTQVLPNGNLVIHGSQEVRVNFETRVMQVSGVVRPVDIRSTAGSENEVLFERIAEGRLVYGGRGQLMDIQQPRWGDQILDILMPF